MGHPRPWLIQFKTRFCVGSKKSRLITLGASELFQGVCKTPFSLSVFFIKHLITNVLLVYVPQFPNAWRYSGY